MCFGVKMYKWSYGYITENKKNKNRYSKKTIMNKKQLNNEIKRLKKVWQVKTKTQLISKLLDSIFNLQNIIDDLQCDKFILLNENEKLEKQVKNEHTSSCIKDKYIYENLQKICCLLYNNHYELISNIINDIENILDYE